MSTEYVTELTLKQSQPYHTAQEMMQIRPQLPNKTMFPAQRDYPYRILKCSNGCQDRKAFVATSPSRQT